MLSLQYVNIEIVILYLGLSSAVQDIEWQASGLEDAGRQYRAWSVMQLGWKSLLKGTQVVRNDDTITLYRKQGSYAQAQREFYAMKPSNVRKAPDGNLLGQVGDTTVYFRGKEARRNEPARFEALILIPSKIEGPKMGIPSKTRKIKAIQYFSHVN